MSPGRRGENAASLFPPPLREVRGWEGDTGRRARALSLQPQLSAQSLAPRRLSERARASCPTLLTLHPSPSKLAPARGPRGVPAPFPAPKSRLCGDSSCPFPVKPRQGKKINATFQRKLCGGRLQQERAAVGRRLPGPGLRGGAAPRPGTAGMRAPRAQPALRGRKHSSAGTRADARRSAARPPQGHPPPRHLLWDSRGSARSARDGTARPHPVGRQARDPAESGRPAPIPLPRRDHLPREQRGRAPTWPRRAAVTRGWRVQTRPTVLPPDAHQPAAFKSPGYSAGGREHARWGCQEGAGRGGTEVGVLGGVWRGGAGTRRKKAGGLQAVFVAPTATGSPRVAPRLPYHYLGRCAAPSPLAAKTFREKPPGSVAHLPSGARLRPSPAHAALAIPLFPGRAAPHPSRTSP